MATYRVGVIGCGGIGVEHAAGLAHLQNTTLAAACDLEMLTLTRFRDRWHGEWPELDLYTDYREMLAREDLDIVTVATSDDRHADLVVDAANAGVKGIFCEKPLATNLADADRMLYAAERNGVILSVDHTRRFQPLWRHIKEQIVDGGEIGAVQYIVGALNGPRAMLFRNGTHLVDSICYYADSDPDWVFAELEAGYEDYSEYRGDGGHDPATEPTASGYIHFANGVRGFFAGGSKASADPKFRCEIVGTTGYVEITRDNAVLIRGDEREEIQAPLWPVRGIRAGVRELVRLVDEGGDQVSPAKDAHRVVEIIVGFLESQRLGNVRVDLPIPLERRGT